MRSCSLLRHFPTLDAITFVLCCTISLRLNIIPYSFPCQLESCYFYELFMPIKQIPLFYMYLKAISSRNLLKRSCNSSLFVVTMFPNCSISADLVSIRYFMVTSSALSSVDLRPIMWLVQLGLDPSLIEHSKLKAYSKL